MPRRGLGCDGGWNGERSGRRRWSAISQITKAAFVSVLQFRAGDSIHRGAAYITTVKLVLLCHKVAALILLNFHVREGSIMFKAPFLKARRDAATGTEGKQGWDEV